jgi:tRNA pseudouridine synthase 10
MTASKTKSRVKGTGFDKHVTKEVLGVAKEVLKFGVVCDHCFGRQFAQLGHGFTNPQRAKAIRKGLVVKAKSGKCSVCGGFFQDLEKLSARIVKDLKGLDFRSFVVGTSLDSKMIEREESLWESVGIEHCEHIRSEINRELGKLIEKATQKRMNRDNPDVTVLIRTEKSDFEIVPTPLFIYGKYKKLVRGIPQTKWELYPETVEGIISKPFMKASKGSAHALHGMGREDIDARCLDWRPFVLEIEKPRKRGLDLSGISRAIGKSGKVKVSGLRFTNRRRVVELKAARPDKSYHVLVGFAKPLKEKDLEKVKALTGKKISQETPSRVLHRRVDKTRKRIVKRIDVKRIGPRKAELDIRGEAGVYVKELVTGDKGRTVPSVSGILKNRAEVLELDVIKIHITKEWK